MTSINKHISKPKRKRIVDEDLFWCFDQKILDRKRVRKKQTNKKMFMTLSNFGFD